MSASQEIPEEGKDPGEFKPGCPIRELRIQIIMGMMMDLSFVRGKTARELAEKWGLHPVTVRYDTAEASRRICEAVMDKESINAAVGCALEAALAGAIRDKQWHNVPKIADVWAKIAGSGAPAKQELSGPNGAPITVDARSALIERLAGLIGGSDADPEASGASGEPESG